MQNQYVGDIGDFGKYGLLREIFGRPEVPESGCGLRLGVAWYLSPDGARFWRQIDGELCPLGKMTRVLEV